MKSCFLALYGPSERDPNGLLELVESILCVEGPETPIIIVEDRKEAPCASEVCAKTNHRNITIVNHPDRLHRKISNAFNRMTVGVLTGMTVGVLTGMTAASIMFKASPFHWLVKVDTDALIIGNLTNRLPYNVGGVVGSAFYTCNGEQRPFDLWEKRVRGIRSRSLQASGIRSARSLASCVIRWRVLTAHTTHL